MLDFSYSNVAYLNLRLGEDVSFVASINNLKLYDFLPLIEQYDSDTAEISAMHQDLKEYDS